MIPANAGLTIAVALAAGVLAQSFSRQIRFPGIVLLLAVGAYLGPEGLGWVAPRSLGEGLFGIVEFGIAIILFEGGLNLEWSRLKRQEATIRRLLTISALTTLVGGACLARFVLGWDWDLALLFGSLVIVTGPTVVAPLLRDLRLQPKLKSILEAEGVLIDPIGALSAVFMLQLVTVPAVSTFAHGVGEVVASVSFGLLAGIVGGILLAMALRHHVFVARGFETIVTLSFVVLLFEMCEHVVESGGLLAVTIAGIVVGNVKTQVNEELREFKDRLTVLLVGLLFVLLSADVSLDDVRNLGLGGGAVVLGLIFVVRPIGVWLSTRGGALPVAERVFIGLIGPRGIVAAAVASLTAEALIERGVPGGEALVALVFLSIAGTVVMSGVVSRPLSWLPGLRLPKRNRVAIAGATGLAIALGRELRKSSVPVIFLESDPKRCRVVEEDGFPVIFDDPLSENAMLRARAELVGTVVGLTFNEHFNGLFVRNAVDGFHIPEAYLAMESLYGERIPGLVTQAQARVLFDGPRDHERWDARWRHGQVSVEQFKYYGGDSVDGSAPSHNVGSQELDRYVILSVRRQDRVEPMHVGFDVRDGDLASVAVFSPQREDVVRALARRGWRSVVATLQED